MADINLALSVIILNVNGIHTAIERQRLAKWINW